MTIKPEPSGMVAPAPAMGYDALGKALTTVSESVREDTWTFVSVDQWKECFDSLEEALPFAALLTAGQRYLWWVSGDLAAALLAKFGSTAGVKDRIGAVFGVKRRTVEYRVRAALEFTSEDRFPDIPTELYREACCWDDPHAALRAALDEGMNAYEMTLLRAGETGEASGPPIWRETPARLFWTERGDKTRYTIVIEEEGSARFAKSNFDVVVTVAPATGGKPIVLNMEGK